MKEKAQELISGMISVWIKNDSLKQPVGILKNETDNIPTTTLTG